MTDYRATLTRLGFREVPPPSPNPHHAASWRMRHDVSGIEIEHWAFMIPDGTMRTLKRFRVVQGVEMTSDATIEQALLTAAWYAAIDLRNDSGALVANKCDPAAGLAILAKHTARLTALESVLRQIITEANP